MNKICDSTSDIISNLPAFVLENFLTCMPLRDAARTSVLSKKWRYKWLLIPQLVFDDGILTIVPGQNNLITRNKLLLVISQVLMLHRAPTLKFTLSIRELESCPEIDNLITFLSSNGLEELTLRFWKGELYKLPSSLFSCTKLTHLSLHRCNFTPPATFEGFSRVVCLELSEVIISKDSSARLISGCPMLEKLKFESSRTCDTLEIDSYSLKISYFTGEFKALRFKNAPRLAIVSLLLKKPAVIRRVASDKEDSFDWFGFFTNLPALENLEMDEHYLKSLTRSTAAPKFPKANTIMRLEILKLHGVCLDDPIQICVALWLMVLSPKLWKVTIEVKSKGERVQGIMYDFQRLGRGTFVFDQLREVQLGITSGTAAELEFIKFLLAKSKVLEKMVVKPDPRIHDGGLKILRALAEFERLSPKAKVTYKDPDLTEAGGRKF